MRSKTCLLLLLLGTALLAGLALSLSGALGVRAAPAAPPAPDAAEIAWSRVYSGTLDGVFYQDLYWGGISTSRLDLVDIDDDGDLDVFMAGENRQPEHVQELHFYRNDGDPGAPVWTHVTGQYLDELGWASNRPSFADLDADGDYDCLLDGGNGFYYYENTGTAGSPTWMLRSQDMLGNGQSGSQTLANVDGDGDLDLFYAVSEEQGGQWLTTITFYENTGTAITPTWTFVTDTYAGITSTEGLHPSFADMDADNDLDLFLGRPTRIMFYRNDGTATVPDWTFVSDTYGGIQFGWGAMHFQVAFGDLNGDGALDMMIGQEGGWVTSYENTGTPTNASWSLWQDPLFPLIYGFTANPALADVDTDGDEDLFLGMGEGWDGARLAFLRNDGTAAFPTWTYVTGQYGNMEVEGEAYPTFVDINGDGDLDCFIGAGPFFGAPGGKISYYENTGTAISPTWSLISDTYAMIDEPDQRVVPSFADIDADGDQDFFVSIEGQHRFYRNDGDATTPDWTLVTAAYAGIGGNALGFADVDGDGDLDVFTDQAFYRNDGNPITPQWAEATTPQGLNWSGGPPALADLQGDDGRPEIVLGGRGGLYLYRNLGDLPPQVSYVAPADGGSGLRAAAVVAGFDNTMDPSTIHAASVTVEGSASGPMTGTVYYEENSRQLVFLPAGSWTEGETVQVTLKASISDAAGNGLDGDGDGVAEGSPVDDYAWSFGIHERGHLVLSLGFEPETLYWYDVEGEGRSVLQAVYDDPIGSRSYSYQPVILTKLPSIDDGDAVIDAVTVQASDWVVDTYDAVVTLTAGVEVRPAGCRSSDCAVPFDGTPLQMDQIQVTFELLEGIRWSDGVTLTADDSVYSYEIHRAEPGLSPPGLGDSSYRLDRTASYEALDGRRTRWTGLPGYLDSTYNLGFWQPLPRHAWEGQGLTPEDLHTAPESTRAPLGWGPYAVSAWEPGVAITLTANPYYYRAGLPEIDTLVFYFTDDNSDLAQAQVLAGESDATWGIGGLPDALLALEGYGAVNAHVLPGSAWEHADIAIDVQDGYVRADFFEDREMRRAIAYCLDRQAIVDEVTAGYAPVLHTYVPPEHPLYPGEDILTVYPHSVTSGTLLLESLGWSDSNGDGIRECNGCSTAGALEGDPLTFKWTTMDIPLRSTYVQMARGDLAECGIELIADLHPMEDLWWRFIQRRYDVGSYAWLIGVEPPCDLYVSEQIPSEENGWLGYNRPAFSNPAYDAACNAALTSLPGTAAHVENHYESMRILSEEVPIVPLFSRLDVAAAHPRLVGLHLDPTSQNVLENVESWTVLVDGLPPQGAIRAGDGSQSQNTTPVTLHLDATDLGGGIVEQMFLRERTWDGSDWAIVAETGWTPYAATYAWDLDPTPAAHYLSAYFMDDQGNVSMLPAQTIVNLTPASGDVLLDEIVVYRLRMQAGESFTATLTTYSGDADLYVWEPGSNGEPDFYSNLEGTAEDQVLVTATVTGDYHLEVHGYAAASSYHLELDAPALAPTLARAAAGPAGLRQSKPLPSAPLTVDVPDDQPAQSPGGLPAEIELRAPRLSLDVGGDSVQLTGEVWDQKGDHVPDGTAVTFTTSLGTFASSGADTTYVVVEDGLVRAMLVSGAEEGQALVTASAGDALARLTLNVRWPYKVYLPQVMNNSQ